MSVDIKAGRSLDEAARDRSRIQTTGFQLTQKTPAEIVHIFQVSEKLFHLITAESGTRGTCVTAALVAAFVGTGLAIVVFVAVVMMVIAVLCLLCWVMVLVIGLIGGCFFLFADNGTHMFEVTLTTNCVSIDKDTVRIGNAEESKQDTNLYDIVEILNVVPLGFDEFHDDAVDVGESRTAGICWRSGRSLDHDCSG